MCAADILMCICLVCVCVCVYCVYVYEYMCVQEAVVCVNVWYVYGVATISRLLKIIGLFAKEPYKRDDILQNGPIA